MARPSKFQLPEAPLVVECRACGQERPILDFRIFRVSPVLHMDFCNECEKSVGTLTLYRRFNAYGTPEIITAVFAASRVPVLRRSAEQSRLLVEPKETVLPTNKEELLQQEMARRELCRRRLIYYTTTMQSDYKPGWVHQDVCRRLENFVRDVEAQKSPRLILAMPPRLGKSLLASDMFPSWVLGKHPEWGIIGSSYAQGLPLDFSRNIRDRLQSRDFHAIFPDAQLRPDAKGIEAWKTTRGGGYVAAGVGVGINGKGMHIGILDDAIKDAEEASSELIRNNTYAWYRAVFRTRLAPGGGILIIGTRWHFDDVTGRELQLEMELQKAGVPPEEREGWELVSYPAIAESDEYLMTDGTIVQGTYDEESKDILRLLRRKGDALHPERWPLSEMVKLRNGMPSGLWSALYQQNPTPADGDFFLKDDIRYRWLDPAYRPLCRIFMTVDYAIGKKERNDFTVAGVFALDANDDLYVLEIRRGRWGTMDIANNIVAMAERHKVEVYAGEQGQLHHAVWPIVQQELDKKRIYLSVDETLVPIQDKETRARPLQGRLQRHKLFFSYDEQVRPDIYDITEREMLQFPNGAHDDIVDMLAWGGRLSLNVSLPYTKAPVQRQKSWTEKLRAHTNGASDFMAA